MRHLLDAIAQALGYSPTSELVQLRKDYQQRVELIDELSEKLRSREDEAQFLAVEFRGFISTVAQEHFSKDDLHKQLHSIGHCLPYLYSGHASRKADGKSWSFPEIKGECRDEMAKLCEAYQQVLPADPLLAVGTVLNVADEILRKIHRQRRSNAA